MELDKSKCFGCTACKAVCPTKAIQMLPDERGFLYPCVNDEKCVGCNRCEQVCPYKGGAMSLGTGEAFAFIHKDKNVLKNCTSGGLFTAISDTVLSKNGVIYGATLDEKLYVHHIRAVSRQDRDRIRGSKYVQSDLKDCFDSIKNDLKKRKFVLFSGTPCQVDGLHHFLGSADIENLLTCDIICNGCPSPLIWEENIKLLEKKLHKKVTGYSFRPKEWGWNIHKEIAYTGTRKHHSTFYTDLFIRLYYSRLIMRNTCNNCPYTSLSRVGDLTMGDCRNIEKVYPEIDTFDGVSLVLINSPKGRQMFEQISDTAAIYPVDINKIIQPPLLNRVRKLVRVKNFGIII